MQKNMIVGISGATGAVYGIAVLQLLRSVPEVVTHLVLSPWAERTIEMETDYSPEAVRALADVVYAPDDLAAPIASGSFPCQGMLVAPCSMKTLAGLASGYTENLLLRAGDVCLKERRPLVLLARETPLQAIHLENMARLTAAGAIVMPPVPAFYTRPQSLEEMVQQTAAHALALAGIEVPQRKRWAPPK